MAIMVKKQAGVPDGPHTGVIINAEETTKVFDPAVGPEASIEVTIQPAWQSPDGAETLPLNVLFSPVLNGLSALSLFLKRLGMEPENGIAWEPTSLIGVEVQFVAHHAPNGFVRVNKDSIKAA